MEAAAEETPAPKVATPALRAVTLGPVLREETPALAPTPGPRVATPPQAEAILAQTHTVATLAAPPLIAARVQMIPTRARPGPTLKRAAAGTLRTPTARILMIHHLPRATPTREGQTLRPPVVDPLPTRERMTIRTTITKMMTTRTRMMVTKTMITPMTVTKMTATRTTTTRTTPRIPKTPRTKPARTKTIKTTTETTTISLRPPKRTTAEKILAPSWRTPVMTRKKTIRHRTLLPRTGGTEQMPNYS